MSDSPKVDDTKSGDELLKRMLKTPPKPHDASPKTKQGEGKARAPKSKKSGKNATDPSDD